MRIKHNDIITFYGISWNDGWEFGKIMNFDKYILKSKKFIKKQFAGVEYTNLKMSNVEKVFGINLKENFEVGIVKLKNILYQKYVIENLSTTQLAKIYNSTDPTIRKYLIELGIGTKDRGGNWN